MPRTDRKCMSLSSHPEGKASTSLGLFSDEEHLPLDSSPAGDVVKLTSTPGFPFLKREEIDSAEQKKSTPLRLTSKSWLTIST